MWFSLFSITKELTGSDSDVVYSLFAVAGVLYLHIVFDKVLSGTFSFALILLKMTDLLNAENKYAHQRETTGLSNDSLQLRLFSKWELLLKERIP